MEFSHGVCEEKRRRRVTTIHDDDGEQTQQQQQQQQASSPIEKEHMFEKVVTPSDVGKLNRLVIPKQHAEKYFPLDTTSSSSSPTDTPTKGLLLNFEDPSGKPWRFRYSYWNSSQSYVMTKGWSRFVKDKRLDAGDIVSFGRHKDRLFIDWKRRGPHNPHRIPIPIPSAAAAAAAAALSYPVVSFAPYSQNYGCNAGGGREQYLVFRSTVAPPQAVGLPMVLDSVPVAAHREEVSAKKFRLFGVNLDVPDRSSGASASPSSASPSPRGKEKEEPSLDLYM